MQQSWALALAVLGAAFPALADTFEIGPGDNLQVAVDALSPGDELVLSGGTYTLPSRFSIELIGTAAQPVVIRARAGEVPIIVYPSATQNTINVEHSAWVVLRGLEVTGGSHGIRILDSDWITVEDCHIHDTADVGLSANVSGSTYEGLVLRRNHIHHTSGTGEGMYLGCNSDACQMFSSLIERNYIHHTNGPGVSQGDGIEIKEGSYDNVVRDNVIHDTGYPCILTYSTVGNGGPNLIERNALWGCGDHAIQAAADAIIRNNVILGAAADGIRNQPHQAGVPGNLEIVHNTVLSAAGSAVRSDGIAGSVVIANNALFSQSGSAIRVSGTLASLEVAGNAGAGGLQGISAGFTVIGGPAAALAAATYSGVLPQDVFPAAGSGLLATGDPAFGVDDDFNSSDRDGTFDAGAYRYRLGGNPGWTLAEGFKELGLFADGFESGDTSAWSSVLP